ncbi:MAG: helix-turn-helix domain-containing protein [Phycisphaeraceae bacterium]|nr:helix-turn-helix domain-containing protein [Phycisphaeraceae bacterium]
MVWREESAQVLAMRTVGQLIRDQRRALGLTLKDIADRVGCTRGYLSSIENDRREHPPSRGMLDRLEEALGLERGRLVSLGEWQSTPDEVRRRVIDLEAQQHLSQRLVELLAKDGVDASFRSGELRRLVERLSAGGGERSIDLIGVLPTQVPLINKVIAGYPREFTDLGYPARVADEYVSVPGVSDADAFAARVVGDSMNPEYAEGDIVVFSPRADALDGSDCFVRLERDEETTFKRVYFERDGEDREVIRLQPLNSAYPPRAVLREEVAGVYAAVYVVRAVVGGGRRGG